MKLDNLNEVEMEVAPQPEKTAGKPKKKEPVEPGKRGRKSLAGDHPLRFVAENHATEAGNTIYVSDKLVGFRSFKVDNNMYAAMNFNTKGIILWLRSKAIAGIEIPDTVQVTEMKHMFDLRIKFYDDENVNANSVENIALIHQLLDASIKYQTEKKAATKKAKADAARAKKEAEKAAAEESAEG